MTMGLNIAVGDVNDDGYDDIIVAPEAGSSPAVRVFSGADGSILKDFYAYDLNVSGGVRVAAADVNGDGVGGHHHRSRTRAFPPASACSTADLPQRGHRDRSGPVERSADRQLLCASTGFSAGPTSRRAMSMATGFPMSSWGPGPAAGRT